MAGKLFGTKTVRIAAHNVVDYQRWLKALGCYTPETTDWFLACAPEPLPITNPNKDSYALPTGNFCPPIGNDVVQLAQQAAAAGSSAVPPTFIRGPPSVR